MNLRPVGFSSQIPLSRPKAFNSSNNVQFGAWKSADDTSGGAPRSGSMKRALFWGLLGLFGVGGAVKTMDMFSHNEPGVHSVLFDKSNGGIQSTVYQPGDTVFLGLRKLIPFQSVVSALNLVENVQVNLTPQVACEDMTPSTHEQKVIPNLRICTEYTVLPENLPYALREKSGNESGSVTAAELQGVTFLKNDDPRMQRWYLQHLRRDVRDIGNTLMPAFEAEDLHTSTEVLSTAYNRGLQNYPVMAPDGTVARRVSLQPLQRRVGDWIRINRVTVNNLQQPPETAMGQEKKAEQPIRQEISVLTRIAEEARERRNRAHAQIGAVEQDEEGRQNAIVNQLRATGTIAVNQEDAQRSQIEEAGKQAAEVIRRDADQAYAERVRAANEEAASIRSTANQTAAETRARATALVEQARRDAEAQEAQILAEVFRNHPNRLLLLRAIEQSNQGWEALRNNPDAQAITIAPGTLNLQILGVNGEGGNNPRGIIGHVLGERAADALRQGQPQVAPATPAPPRR